MQLSMQSCPLWKRWGMLTRNNMIKALDRELPRMTVLYWGSAVSLRASASSSRLLILTFPKEKRTCTRIHDSTCQEKP